MMMMVVVVVVIMMTMVMTMVMDDSKGEGLTVSGAVSTDKSMLDRTLW